MKNYKLKYYSALKRWKKAMNQYFKETGIKICANNFYEIINKDNAPKYLVNASNHLEDADDNFIIYKQNHRNRKKKGNKIILKD